ncbi:MAG: glycosyltransferase, partial [Anaerolineaceae bacterium]|nr:glycosyltransferase [Anaerolineaceae bacterium]
DNLPHDKVLELMKNCDVGLLPTYADSYGFSVLEEQACGLPVISTDVRALPEINNTSVGWIIRVPKNELGEALYSTPEERERLSQQIQSGMEAIISSIVADPSVIYTKAAAAIERVRDNHDPQVYAQKLREIYQEALAEKQ